MAPQRGAWVSKLFFVKYPKISMTNQQTQNTSLKILTEKTPNSIGDDISYRATDDEQLDIETTEPNAFIHITFR